MGSNDENPRALVGGAEVGCSKHVPPAIEPERGQITEHFGEEFSPMKSNEVCDVLHEDVAGSKLANDALELPPKRSLGMAKPFAEAGAADAAAGESAGDEDDGLGSCVDVSNIGVSPGIGEPLGEDLFAAPFVGFGAPSEVGPAGEVEAEVEESDSGEEAPVRGHT